eukprot:CAMPEP_0195527130 /NCGR_PEP_ID=MMETSP0794_2-20130614/28617_1 /TAXON_ID=515487 /ORGANISM="Stephanopyxis turris, Strain CCMP 815" /LENGTH=110 /DNA_ID=CAMNT_0040657975 /DNA_START=1 /DNA_END=330 /DNA_ORIENTATION=-
MGPSDLPVYELSQLSLFNSLSFGVWVASFAPGASKYIFANDKCTEMFGQSREHMYSLDLEDGASVGILKYHQKIYQDCQVDEKILPSFVRTLYPNGKAMTIECDASPIRV